MTFRGKTIVITGASSGIGEAAAKRLAALGARVCLVARREAELERVKGEIDARGGAAFTYPADLASAESAGACAAAILAAHPRIDVLVNNAARSIRRPVRGSVDRAHDFERTVALNYLGAVRLTLAFVPRFLEQRRGHVVLSSTMSTQVPIPLFSAYLASKAALESFGRSLAAELGHEGLAVTTIHFPMVRTPMSSRTDLYAHMRMMSVEGAAGLVERAIATRPARIAPLLGVLGGVLLAALPGPTIHWSQAIFREMDRRLKRKLQREPADDGSDGRDGRD